MIELIFFQAKYTIAIKLFIYLFNLIQIRHTVYI